MHSDCIASKNKIEIKIKLKQEKKIRQLCRIIKKLIILDTNLNLHTQKVKFDTQYKNKKAFTPCSSPWRRTFRKERARNKTGSLHNYLEKVFFLE